MRRRRYYRDSVDLKSLYLPAYHATHILRKSGFNTGLYLASNMTLGQISKGIKAQQEGRDISWCIKNTKEGAKLIIARMNELLQKYGDSFRGNDEQKFLKVKKNWEDILHSLH